MPNKADIHRRVNRLLAGQRTPRDLDAIFLWLRTRCHEHEPVRDIGDFVAHGDKRDRGVAWAGVRSISATLEFHIPRIMQRGRGPTPPSNKQALEEAVLASLHLARPEAVKAETAFEKARVAKILRRAFKKIVSFDGTRIVEKDPLDETEKALIQRYASTLNFHASFTAEELIHHFRSCLLRNDLVSVGQANEVYELNCPVAIYAIERMHLSKIALKNGTVVQLRAASPNNCLFVSAMVETPNDWATRHLYVPVFETFCKSDFWCDPKLLKVPHHQWDFPLEVNAAGKLAELN